MIASRTLARTLRCVLRTIKSVYTVYTERPKVCTQCTQFAEAVTGES